MKSIFEDLIGTIMWGVIFLAFFSPIWLPVVTFFLGLWATQFILG